MKTIATITIIVLSLYACTNPTDENGCDAAGDWKIEVTTVGEGCHESGQTETFTVTVKESDLSDDCTAKETAPMSSPESETEYGLDGDLTIELRFDGDRVTGQGTLKADLIEAGEPVDQCEQAYTVSGKRAS